MRLFLSGDVMTGRGIDQVLAHPVSSRLYEPYIRDARGYVELAEGEFGPLPKPVDDAYIWGDALEALEQLQPDARIINLETSVTTADEPWPQKGIHYRMHPQNIGCLTAAGIDVCCLANNHVLDWGGAGLVETLRTLEQAGLQHAGAGHDVDEAHAPAVLDLDGESRVLVFALGSATSGIYGEWDARPDRPGVWLLPDLSTQTARSVAETMLSYARDGEIVVASIHWGGNWGFEIPRQQQEFARALIDAGIALVQGHSSHHVKGIELYRDRLILYGCGDLITDYEGISGHSEFRGDLGLLYVPQLRDDGSLERLQMAPMRMRGFRLARAEPEERQWLHDALNRESRPFGVGVSIQPDGLLELQRT